MHEVNPEEANTEAIGLCTACRHHQAVRSARGPTYHRCALSVRDPAFDKYPRLPVLNCGGFECREPSAAP